MKLDPIGSALYQLGVMKESENEVDKIETLDAEDWINLAEGYAKLALIYKRIVEKHQR